MSHHHDHDHCCECGWTTQHVHQIIGICTEILRTLKQPQLTRMVAVTFQGVDNMPQPNNALTFNVGQTSTASIMPLSADGTTPSNGVVSNATWTFSDPSATVVPSNDGLTAVCTGVAPSTGPVSGSMSCTVTDTDGAVSTWTQSFTITTNPATVSQTTQSVAVQFTDPVPAGGTITPPLGGVVKPAARPLNE